MADGSRNAVSVLLPHAGRAGSRAGHSPKHAAYWQELHLDGYLGGPFADRSGGLITFQAESGAAAEALVANDPFLQEHLLERHWVKEWLLD